jgi:hypothetical protein
MSCMFLTYNSVLVVHVWSTLVFLIVWLDVYLLVLLGDSPYMSCAAFTYVFGVGFLFYRVDGLYVLLSSV